MAPRVSVVMPVYNGERFIAEAVKSALASDFGDLELLIVDDGSTDNSVEVASEAAAGDPRLRIITLPHGGVGAARNAALENARGEFIANVDSDDAMFPNRLARQLAYLDGHPECVAVGSRSVVVDANGRPSRITGRFFVHEEIDRNLLAGNGGAIGNETAMIRRSAALAAGGYAAWLQASGEDHDLWLRLAEIGRLACVPEVLVRYRIHDTNSSIGPGSRERRLPVTLDTLSRAFARRGIIDRKPAKLASPPMTAAERWGDRALIRYYSGDRAGAIWWIVIACLLCPTAPATRHAIGMILRQDPPRW